ncbi:MAG TPA: cyclic nucleotide-binding domain-containing protein [candidate division Zixibacteria bacterium]|nr:cyclic nucleotide-binding domain-containing protein [candidate division Zixibacteria bacterium]
MISPETLRRYSFFACLTYDQIVTLAMAGQLLDIEAGGYFFHEGDNLDSLFFVLEGNIDIAIGIPDRTIKQHVHDQIMGNFIAEDVTVSTVSPGQIFAWSALIPPHVSTASAKATLPSRVISFDCEALMQAFQKDCIFGNLMLQKIAVVIRQRLRNMHIQSLAFIPA